MNYLFIFCIFLLLFCALILIAKLREANIRKALSIPKHTAPTDDSFEQAREIGNFLHQRAQAGSIRLHNAPDVCGIDRKDYYRISCGEDHAISQLIRLCHSVGCEIVIRQTGTDDLESRTNTPDVFAEKIIRMKEQRSM